MASGGACLRWAEPGREIEVLGEDYGRKPEWTDIDRFLDATRSELVFARRVRGSLQLRHQPWLGGTDRQTH